jgi:hypothetical protein
MNMDQAPQVVVEVDPFPRQADAIWDDIEREEFIDFIARHSEAGDEIPGTGGVRKVRWSRKGMGKRGGARVIYYYYNTSAPIFLLSVYAKGEKADLSSHEKSALRKVVAAIRAEVRARHKES